AGAGNNFLLGGAGSDFFRGNLSKDVIVGEYAAIYTDPVSGRVVNLTRFGQGGNRPDPFANANEMLFSKTSAWGQASKRVHWLLDAISTDQIQTGDSTTAVLSMALP